MPVKLPQYRLRELCALANAQPSAPNPNLLLHTLPVVYVYGGMQNGRFRNNLATVYKHTAHWRKSVQS